MCGVHNYTKALIVQNLHSFVMKGVAESNKNVIIDHQIDAQFGNPNCAIINFSTYQHCKYCKSDNEMSCNKS